MNVNYSKRLEKAFYLVIYKTLVSELPFFVTSLHRIKIKNHLIPSLGIVSKTFTFITGSDGAAPLVAFTAYLDKIITNPPADTSIPFNRVLLNEGNGYNVTSGKFTSPQAGVYLFTFGLESDAPHFLVASLFVDGVNLVNSVCIQYQNGGNTAMVRLNAGSSVWVGTSGANATIWNSDKLHYSTFSGILLN